MEEGKTMDSLNDGERLQSLIERLQAKNVDVSAAIQNDPQLMSALQDLQENNISLTKPIEADLSGDEEAIEELDISEPSISLDKIGEDLGKIAERIDNIKEEDDFDESDVEEFF